MDRLKGLTTQEAEERAAKGLVNVNPDAKHGKSVKEIVLSNLVTFFNILNLCFFIAIIVAGSYKNCLFMIIVLINAGIGIFQEIRTKKKLDSMAILTASHQTVFRDGAEKDVLVEELVMDDVMKMKAGDQIPADAVILSGEIEVNESMLTGEADNITKKAGATIYSGSFITSGEAVAEVIHVGKENYVETISGEAKTFKKVNSQLRNSMNKILKVVSYFIIPLCVGLFLKVFFVQHATWQEAISQMVTSGIGMIPEGLYLLTSIALTLGVLRLAKKRTIVQELYCIETLARVDVLCLDKTGTLTEGTIRLENIYPKFGEEKLSEGFRNILAASCGNNATSEGLLAYFGAPEKPWDTGKIIPFSSERKYSGASFPGHGTYYMGAAQFLFPGDKELIAEVDSYAKEGLRVIVLAHTDEEVTDYMLPENLMCLGFVTMSDVIREDCEKTLQFFKEQGVALKCISGDDPVTVSHIAVSCGMEGAENYIDMSTVSTEEEIAEICEKYTVFGRVKPDQKKMLVRCLQDKGHIVAMTGDGVNDVLALTQADCSIAMASGAEATKHAANIVLLDSNFSSMPSVVREGRRVINNICSASAMYLIKTTFSVLLTIGTILIGKQYPFEAIQLSVISGCAVGIPTALLQLEPSFKPISKHFMSTIFRNAFPPGFTIAIVTFLITNIGLAISDDKSVMMSTICVLCIGWVYFFMLRRIYSPLTTYRRVVCYTMEVVYLLMMILGQHIILGETPLLNFSDVSPTGVLILLGVVTLAPIFIDIFCSIYDRFIDRHVRKLAEESIEEQQGGKEVEVLVDGQVVKGILPTQGKKKRVKHLYQMLKATILGDDFPEENSR